MDAAKLLKDYLTGAEGVTYEKFGALLGVTRQTIWAWVNGSVPSEAIKADIERHTSGAVPAAAWPVADRRKKTEEPAA
jgi:hypothetical protein